MSARTSATMLAVCLLGAGVLSAHVPVVETRVAPILTVDGQRFRDLDKSGTLDAYEDWRLPVSQRVSDLVSRMTLEEKAGMLMIDTLNAETNGKLPDRAPECVEDQKMTRFIFSNTCRCSTWPSRTGSI